MSVSTYGLSLACLLGCFCVEPIGSTSLHASFQNSTSDWRVGWEKLALSSTGVQTPCGKRWEAAKYTALSRLRASQRRGASCV